MTGKARKPRVLVIDDDAIVRETVRIALGSGGFEALTLESPALAHTVVRQSKPDLILMDLYMPELNGLDLCRKLKADPETKRIPVVLFTGSNETVDVISGIDAGAFEYLTKPIDGDQLIAKLRALLNLGEPKKGK